MAADTSHCDRDRLKKLLDGELAPDFESEVTHHLGKCEHCRQQLESFAADESWWQNAQDALSGIKESGDADSWDDVNRHQEFPLPTVPLDFLAKSDNPAMLGRLGEFEILEPIGCGGMGIVLKGYDHELNRYVAVKVLHPYCATSAAARRRFAREAQAAAAVVHQHVVAIYAVGANHHPPYLVMPFVPGESLQQRLNRQGTFEVIDVLRIGQQVAEGLAAAHAQGLVHRDIKPGNILLERNVERVLLTDFGLARAEDDASLTQSGVIAGTPQFMSPEQTRGEQVDHRTDLFSLGTVMYTLLAGHSPFRAETAVGVLRRVCDDTPRPLREINPNVPAWLEAFISKLHSKQPSSRFESAAQVAELLKGCLAHTQQPTRVQLPTDVTAILRQVARQRLFRPWVFGTVAVVISAITLLIAGVLQTSPRSKVQTNQFKVEPIVPPIASRSAEWDDLQKQEINDINKAIEHLEKEFFNKF